jgi:hypothetical protein
MEDNMSYNFVLGVEESKRQYQERLQQAEHNRLVKQLKAAQPGLQERLLLNIGRTLVSLGDRLISTDKKSAERSHSGSTAAAAR